MVVVVGDEHHTTGCFVLCVVLRILYTLSRNSGEHFMIPVDSISKPTGFDRIRSFPFEIDRFHLKPIGSKICETDRIELESMSHSKPTGIDRIRSFPFGIYRFHLKPTRSKIYETDRIELESMSNSKPIGFDRIRSFPFEIYRFHLKPIGSRIGSATHRQRRDMSDRRTSAWN